MRTVETSIWMALRQRVVSIPGGYAIAMPKVAFAKPSTNGQPDPYVQVDNMHNDPERMTIGSDGPADRRGILTLSLMYPVALNHDETVITEAAGKIAAHWPQDLKLPMDGIVVRIEAPPRVVDAMRDDAYWRTPITIRWRTFA